MWLAWFSSGSRGVGEVLRGLPSGSCWMLCVFCLLRLCGGCFEAPFFFIFSLACFSGVSLVLCAVFALRVGWGSDGLRLVEGWDFGCFSPVISYFLFHLAKKFYHIKSFFPISETPLAHLSSRYLLLSHLFEHFWGNSIVHLIRLFLFCYLCIYLFISHVSCIILWEFANKISYHYISYHIISYIISYHIISYCILIEMGYSRKYPRPPPPPMADIGNPVINARWAWLKFQEFPQKFVNSDQNSRKTLQNLAKFWNPPRFWTSRVWNPV